MVLSTEEGSDLRNDWHENKKRKSEAQRVASILAKRRLEKERQSLIASTLKNIDSISHSKKITFASDSESDHSVHNDPKKTSTLKLFDETDKDFDDLSFNDSIKNRHIGLKGAKLMAMESKFGNDERFKLNSKFEDDIEQTDDNEESQESNEKAATLKILSKVLGKEVTRGAAKDEFKKMDNKHRTAPFLRFDPENEQHLQWMQSLPPTTSRDSDDEISQDSEEKSDDEKLNSEDRFVPNRFFDVDPNFAEILRKNTREGSSEVGQKEFSFLKSVGRSSDVEYSNRKKKLLSIQLPSPSTEAKKVEVEKIDVPSLTESKTDSHSGKVTKYFFLLEDDNEVANVINNFKRKQPIDKIKRKWSSIRGSVIKVYKGQRRAVKRRNKNAASGNKPGKSSYNNREDKAAANIE